LIKLPAEMAFSTIGLTTLQVGFKVFGLYLNYFWPC
jgi:hypothetical protein